MARMIWYHFCEHHLTDASGKNSYIAVFDTMTMGIRSSDPTKELSFPLTSPIPTQPFVLSVGLHARPGAREQYEVRLVDSNGQAVLPPMTGTLTAHPEGKHTLHLNFPRGIPILTSGIHTFHISVGGTEVCRAELPISVTLEEEGDS